MFHRRLFCSWIDVVVVLCPGLQYSQLLLPRRVLLSVESRVHALKNGYLEQDEKINRGL